MEQIYLVDPSRYSPTYVDSLGHALREFGHGVFFCGRDRRPSEPTVVFRLTTAVRFYRLSERLREVSRHVGQLVKVPEHFLDLVRLAMKLRGIDRSVVHIQWMVVPVLDGLFLRVVGRRHSTVTTVHNSNPVHGAASWSPQTLGMTWAQRQAHVAIGHTQFTIDSLASKGIDPERLFLIPLGLLHEPTNVEQFRRRGQNPKLRVLAFGRIRPYKGTDVLIRAVAELDAETRNGLEVHIAGDAMMDVEPLQQLASDLQVDSCIEWSISYMTEDEAAECFERADVLALPYRDVDGSAVLVDGQAHGLAVVASSVGGFEQLLDDGRNGLLVAPDNVDELAAALRRLIENRDLVGSLSEESRRSGLDLPTWQEIASAHVAAYRMSRS